MPLLRGALRLSCLGLAEIALLAACGGTTASPQQGLDSGAPASDGGPLAPDAGPAPDASSPAPDSSEPAPDAGTGPGATCPGAAPSPGAPCTGTLACEYGSDPDVVCDVVATCESGQWSLRPAAGGSTCTTTSGSTCPATYADLSSQSTCAPSDTVCVYPQARCVCSFQCQMVGSQSLFWCCPDAPSGSTGCPSPRPRIGSTCPTDGAVCDYGGCTGNVTLQCTAGAWQPTTQVACPG